MATLQPVPVTAKPESGNGLEVPILQKDIITESCIIISVAFPHTPVERLGEVEIMV